MISRDSIKKAKESSDKGEIYKWESPFIEHKFESGEKIIYFSVTNYKSSKDKINYVGTEATVEKDNGDRILVKTDIYGFPVSKFAVIKSESFDKKNLSK